MSGLLCLPEPAHKEGESPRFFGNYARPEPNGCAASRCAAHGPLSGRRWALEATIDITPRPVSVGDRESPG
jgi:hypothetical protein